MLIDGTQYARGLAIVHEVEEYLRTCQGGNTTLVSYRVSEHLGSESFTRLAVTPVRHLPQYELFLSRLYKFCEEDGVSCSGLTMLEQVSCRPTYTCTHTHN